MRILIVKLGAIGDVVHTLPALSVLRKSFPDAHITWAVEAGGAAQILKDNICIDDLIVLSLRRWRKSLSTKKTLLEIRDTISSLRKEKYDLSLDFQGLFKSAMVPILAGVPRRIGFEKSALREPASSIFLTEQVEADDKDHIIKKNLQLVRHLGADITGDYEFPVYLSPEDKQFADNIKDRFNSSYAILNPGGGWPTKLWSPMGFSVIADKLWDMYKIHPIITYGPGEEGLAQSIINNSHSGKAIMIDSTLKQFWAIAQNAVLFVGGDTGPMHIAAAAGTPIVALFGPTPSRRNGPFNKNDVVVERFDIDCRVDCFRRSCSHTSCMKIPADTVWQGVEKRLSKFQVSSFKFRE